jgi:hypothetical protein
MLAESYLNKGAIPSGFDRIDAGFSPCQCTSTGALWTNKPKRKGYPAIKNYHVLDYNLFYINIRDNVKLRVDKYLSQHP